VDHAIARDNMEIIEQASRAVDRLRANAGLARNQILRPNVGNQLL
jgi:hypothetical protein